MEADSLGSDITSEAENLDNIPSGFSEKEVELGVMCARGILSRHLVKEYGREAVDNLDAKPLEDGIKQSENGRLDILFSTQLEDEDERATFNVALSLNHLGELLKRS